MIDPDDGAETALKVRTVDVRPILGWGRQPEPSTLETDWTPESDRPAQRRGVAMARAHLDPAKASEAHIENCDMGAACPFRAGWRFENHAIGVCVSPTCGLPCRSADPTGIVRHVQCEGPA